MQERGEGHGRIADNSGQRKRGFNVCGHLQRSIIKRFKKLAELNRRTVFYSATMMLNGLWIQSVHKDCWPSYS